ncbi:MAG: sugar ABC transporter ATP-binding protein [Pontiellaceae bacterium]|nr:sugar ABC transporter ATP-binding protein [Pontiellaceae bacterium]
MTEPTTYSLRMEHISKSFGPVQALKDVTFAACPGTVHALCGENGAGKSTLMKVLSGVYIADSGTIEINGEPQDFTEPGQAIEAGISMLYQELDLAEHMMVYENVFLGREIMSSIPFRIDAAEMIRKTRELCEQYGFRIDPESLIRSLTPGECQIVELLKALMRSAKVIVMDEPTSSLSESEAHNLFKVVRELRERGLTIIYISHRMEEVMDLSDDISVLRDGEVVHTDRRENMKVDDVVRHMVGRELKDFYPARDVEVGEVCLEVQGLSSEEGVKDVSFDVRRGEVVGMAGLVGAGRSETARAMFGVVRPTAGTICFSGRELTIKHPSDAIQQGMALLTEDRKRTGLCAGLPCGWNITLPNYEKIGMKALLKLAKERELCEELGAKVKVKWEGPDAPATSLSGGNQQKLLVARWLMADAEFIIFDEPTRGIDVGAKKEVYTIINELAAEGKAQLVISSELPELFGICDRILVMRRGRIVGNFVTAETTPEKVMHAAAVEDTQ